jgi:hypothetical protein
MRPSVVNLIRGSVVKRRMSAFFIVEANPVAQALAEFETAGERMQVKVVMFDGPPEPSNKYVILASNAAVHAYAYALVFENLGETDAGKLSSP